MATRLPSVDALLVGFGWTGAILAQELTDEGLEVLALQRGVWRDTSAGFAVTNAEDEVRFRYRNRFGNRASLVEAPDVARIRAER